MQFQYFFAAGFLMQAVDVLRDDCLQLAIGLKLRQFSVGDVGFRIKKNDLVTVKFIKLRLVPDEKGIAEDSLRRVFVLLVIQPVDAAEIRYPAFCRHTGPAEENDVAAFIHPFSQDFHTGHNFISLSNAQNICCLYLRLRLPFLTSVPRSWTCSWPSERVYRSSPI